jgi:hypothetical protein
MSRTLGFDGHLSLSATFHFIQQVGNALEIAADVE